MSSSCHSRWLVGEGSDDNYEVDHGEDQDLGDDDSQGDHHERGGEDELEEDINWRASAFYIGKFFTKQPDSSAKCISLVENAQNLSKPATKVQH